MYRDRYGRGRSNRFHTIVCYKSLNKRSTDTDRYQDDIRIAVRSNLVKYSSGQKGRPTIHGVLVLVTNYVPELGHREDHESRVIRQ